MKLPNAENVVVERQKIVDYLLNAAHPDNGGKAQFFEALGFSADGWEALAAAFRSLARTTELTKSMTSPHGIKYVIINKLESPAGIASMVKTIWIVDTSSNMPRLVTAYPHEE